MVPHAVAVHANDLLPSGGTPLRVDGRTGRPAHRCRRTAKLAALRSATADATAAMCSERRYLSGRLMSNT
jgi:hypothetical protein